jgi:large subunit ribosomal protein L13
MTIARTTTMPRKEDVERRWYVVDAEGKVLGRLASAVAMVLSGKNKPGWAPHVDVGDHVVIVNAERVVLTGRKLDEKVYRRHSGYPGGLKEITARQLIGKAPEELIRHAVEGMLPKTRLGRAMGKKLKVYRGPQHPHAAQEPQPLAL